MLKANFVDTNLRYDLSTNLADNKETTLSLWKKDYGYVCVFVESIGENTASVNVASSKLIDSEIFMLDKTLAFIGSAGYKAENPFSIMPRGPKKEVDDVVVPYKEISLKDKEYKNYLIKFSSNDLVGNEKIEIKVNEETLRINIEVIDKEMPKPEDYSFKVEYWQHPYNVSDYYNVAPFSKEHIDILRKHQLLYKSLGGSGVTCTVLDEVWGGQTYGKGKIKYPSMVKWTLDNGKWLFDYDILDKWVELNLECGLSDKFICYSMMPWGNNMRYFDKKKGKYKTKKVILCSKLYNEMWGAFLNNFIKHLDEKGWFDSFYIGFDERSNMNKILDLVESYKNKDGKSLKISASFNNYLGNKACLDRIDSAAVGVYEIRAHEKEYIDIVEERKRLKKKTLLYTATDNFPNSFTLSMPGESYYSIMYALASNNDGFLRWAYDAWVKNPLKDTTHFSFQAGDCFLIYPAKEGINPNLSYRMIKLDEGVRDANKLNILKKEEKNQARIEKLLKNIWYDYGYDVAYSRFWGPCIHKTKWLNVQGEKDLNERMQNIKKEIESMAKNN